MSISMVHNFNLSFEQNAINNCERFMSAGEPLQKDLLSQVQTVIRQNEIMISQYKDEIEASKANLENTLRTTYRQRVREWDRKRQAHYEREIQPLEAKIAFRQAQNKRLQACLDFHNKEIARREKLKLDKHKLEYPKRIKDLSSRGTTRTDKALIKAVYSFAKVLGNRSLFQAVESLVSIPQAVKRLEQDRLILESKGVSCDEIPPELYEKSEEMRDLCRIVEHIVGRPYQAHRAHRPIRLVQKNLELSRIREQQMEKEARCKEGVM